jgi:hypothetical protein
MPEISMSTIRSAYGGGSAVNGAGANKLALTDYYRGGAYPAGLVGIFTGSAKVADLIRGKWVGQRITGSTGAPTEISLSFESTSGLTKLTGGWTSGGADDGYWALTIPWSINFLGVAYTTVYPATNGYITFGTGSTAYSGLSASNPPYPKIVWGGADNSGQQIYYGAQGTSPNRTYRIRIEGNNTTSGTTDAPTMLTEIIFYENAPSQIDIHIWQNSKCDNNNVATPGGAVAPATSSTPSTIPTGASTSPAPTVSSNAGTISMSPFQGVTGRVLTAVTAGYFTMSSQSSVTITTGSGKYLSSYTYYYGGWREAGYDQAGNAAGNNTNAFGTPSVQSTFITVNGSYFPRAWYYYYDSSGNGSIVLTLSCPTGYPIVNDGTIPSFTFPMRNPSTGAIIDMTLSSPYGTENFMVGSLFCTKISKANNITPLSSYYPPGGTARNMIINAYV